jgi:hypothetical protein
MWVRIPPGVRDMKGNEMRTPKPRPARRGYVIAFLLAGLAVWVCTEIFRVSPLVSLVIVLAGIGVIGGASSLRHWGINREIKNRR